MNLRLLYLNIFFYLNIIYIQVNVHFHKLLKNCRFYIGTTLYSLSRDIVYSIENPLQSLCLCKQNSHVITIQSMICSKFTSTNNDLYANFSKVINVLCASHSFYNSILFSKVIQIKAKKSIKTLNNINDFIFFMLFEQCNILMGGERRLSQSISTC